VLRGPGGGSASARAAQGTLGTLWMPIRISRAVRGTAPDEPRHPPSTGAD
jgi:hypothetical protein